MWQIVGMTASAPHCPPLPTSSAASAAGLSWLGAMMTSVKVAGRPCEISKGAGPRRGSLVSLSWQGMASCQAGWEEGVSYPGLV